MLSLPLRLKGVCIIFEVRGILCNYVFSLLTSCDVQPSQDRKLSKARKAVTSKIKFDDSLPEANSPGEYVPRSKLGQGTHNKKANSYERLFGTTETIPIPPSTQTLLDKEGTTNKNRARQTRGAHLIFVKCVY